MTAPALDAEDITRYPHEKNSVPFVRFLICLIVNTPLAIGCEHYSLFLLEGSTQRFQTSIGHAQVAPELSKTC